MESQFRSLLTDDATVSALVAARVYWNAIPQAATDPCVVMYVISRNADAHHGGPSGLNNTLIQVDIRAVTFTSAVAVRDAIVTRLHAKRLIQDGIEFVTNLLNERHTSEKPGAVLYHRISLDFSAWSGNAG